MHCARPARSGVEPRGRNGSGDDEGRFYCAGGGPMPISYSIDHDRRLIVETWTGDITADDLGAYWRSYLTDPEVLDIRRTLVDLRQCTILFTGALLAGLVDGIVLPILEGRDW